jgi:hypothetical protein
MKAMTSSSYTNRWVVALTPLVFAPIAGSISVLAARYLPGVDIDKNQVEAIFIAGATIAFAKAGLWLKGWQDHEKAKAPPSAPPTTPPPGGTTASAAVDAGDLPDPHAEPDLEEDSDDAPVDGDAPLVTAQTG